MNKRGKAELISASLLELTEAQQSLLEGAVDEQNLQIGVVPEQNEDGDWYWLPIAYFMSYILDPDQGRVPDDLVLGYDPSQKQFTNPAARSINGPGYEVHPDLLTAINAYIAAELRRTEDKSPRLVSE